MTRFSVVLFCVGIIMNASCATDECPAGSERNGERCITVDASVPTDSSMTVDAGHDGATTDAAADAAIVCSPTCGGSLPFCVDGACVECNVNDDCFDASPLCLNHTCSPCSEGSCTSQQIVGEIAARSCSQFTSYLQNTSFDSLRAATCAGIYQGARSYVADMLAGLADGRLTYAGAEFEECTDEDVDQTKSCDGTIGVVPGGGACFSSSECASGNCNLTSACPGTCAPEVAEHGSCTGDAVCETGFACLGGHCEAGGHNGEACVAGACVHGECRDGTCGPYALLGDTCTRGSLCGTTMICDDSSVTCRPFHGVDEVCDMTDYGPRCAAGAQCVGGRCYAALAEGDACTPENAATCTAGTVCSDGHCERIRTNRERCGPAPCALGLRCVEGRCGSLPTLGEACVATEGCLRGTCRSGMCVSLNVSDPCIVSNIFGADALDACGEGSTCITSGATTRCVADASTGEMCGPAIAACADSTERCANSGVAYPTCIAGCHPSST